MLHRLWDSLASVCCLAGSLDFCLLSYFWFGFLARVLLCWTFFAVLCTLSVALPKLPLTAVLRFLPLTCMSQVPTCQDGDVELRIDLPGNLRVLVTGPASSSGLAAELLGHIALFRSRSVSPSDRSFEVVSSVGASDSVSVSAPVDFHPASRAVETRDSILRSFKACPNDLFKHSSRLCGSTLSGSDRISRAWIAGQWARAVQDKRIGSPNRTPAIDLRPRFYAVLAAEGLGVPTIFKSSASYWRCIGSLENSNSISQSFPSEVEARIYLQGAGVTDVCITP